MPSFGYLDFNITVAEATGWLLLSLTDPNIKNWAQEKIGKQDTNNEAKMYVFSLVNFYCF